jgi:hypothetical protein
VYYRVPRFAAPSAANRVFYSDSLSGRMYVAVFVHPDSMQSQLALLAEDLKLNTKKYTYARFVFFLREPREGGTDIERDLGGRKGSMITLYLPGGTYDSLRTAFFVTDRPGAAATWQTPYDAVIIDHKSRIRGYYNLRYADQLKRLKEDVNYIHQRDQAAEAVEQTTIEKKP